MDCSNLDNRDISSFTYVNYYKLGIVIVTNLKGLIDLEDVSTRRVVQL
jgi:hypothetical protein